MGGGGVGTAEGRGQRAEGKSLLDNNNIRCSAPLLAHTPLLQPHRINMLSACQQVRTTYPNLLCDADGVAAGALSYRGGCTQGPTTHHFPPFQVTSATPLCCWEGIVGVRKSPPTLPQKSPLRKGGKKIAQKISPLPFFQNAKTPYWRYQVVLLYSQG